MKYITVKLTEDQAEQLSRLLTQHLSDTERVAREYQTSVIPEFTAFIRRIQTKLAKAKS